MEFHSDPSRLLSPAAARFCHPGGRLRRLLSPGSVPSSITGEAGLISGFQACLFVCFVFKHLSPSFKGNYRESTTTQRVWPAQRATRVLPRQDSVNTLDVCGLTLRLVFRGQRPFLEREGRLGETHDLDGQEGPDLQRGPEPNARVRERAGSSGRAQSRAKSAEGGAPRPAGRTGQAPRVAADPHLPDRPSLRPRLTMRAGAREPRGLPPRPQQPRSQAVQEPLARHHWTNCGPSGPRIRTGLPRRHALRGQAI